MDHMTLASTSSDAGLLHPHTNAPATTLAPDGDMTTGFSLTGVFILIIVLVIIVCIVKRRFSKEQEKEQELEMFDSEEDDPEKLQLRLFGDRTSYFDITKSITDPELLTAIQSVSISINRLSLSRQLGKVPTVSTSSMMFDTTTATTPATMAANRMTGISSIRKNTTFIISPTTTTAITITTLQNNTQKNGISYGISGFILFAVILGIVIYFRAKSGGRHDDSENEAEEDAEDGEDELELPALRAEMQRLCSVDGSKKWMDEEGGVVKYLVEGVVIDCQRLTLGEMIGKGQFGAVYEAKLAPVSDGGSVPANDYCRVAVKTLKGVAMDSSEVEAFLREGILMKDFHHKHVLSLVGVAFGDHGVPMIILPFMANGSLRDYITQQDLHLNVRRLLEFGYMVSQGMDYLAKQKFVHRDIATRNCMLDEELCVKVADFGLSRDIYTKEYYATSDRDAKLPVKWMALESLMSGVYTTKSDVWSFGVLLWELITRGVTPYPDVANWDMRNYISAGRRMAKPDQCPEDIYDMMLNCWHKDPKSRPSFEQLEKELDEILHEDDDDDARASGRDFYINIEPMTP